MKVRIFIALIFTTACWAACADGVAPKASVQACDEAMRALDVARKTSDKAVADAEKQVFKHCYTGSGRSPAVQAPISIYSDRKAVKPVVPVLPAPQELKTPSTPSVITTCDAGGCWDNLGNRYHGSGTTLFGNTGKPCIRNGDRIECR
jgi:hypothetical protein